MASLTSLKRTGKRPYRRVGRGQSSTRGKQSGRGGKGQTARAGHKIRPAIRDIIKKLPKRRGHGKNRGRTVNPTKPEVVAISLTKLASMFDGGEVTSQALIERGLIGRKERAKIVGGLPGQGETSKKFTLRGIGATASARAAIEKAGGDVA
jgi:large subunit ribosomal protein L15